MPERKKAAPRSYHHGDLRRVLIDASAAIVSEEQNWNFSLREVARRAEVSHSAPFNHFPEKRHLLDAVAAVGFDELAGQMSAAATGIDDPSTKLTAAMRAYVAFAVSNPARYRLMFGSALVPDDNFRPALTDKAGARAKLELREVIMFGAESGSFAIDRQAAAAVDGAVLTVWSVVHGLAMLLLDAKVDPSASTERQAGIVSAILLAGLQHRKYAGA